MFDEIISSLSILWLEFLKLLPRIIISFIILLLFVLFSGQFKKLVYKRLEGKSVDRLRAVFLAKVSKWIFLITGFVISMEVLGLASVAGGILTGAGVSAVILGFAFKNIGENFLSGLLLAFNRPFKIGDIIEVDKYLGSVTSLDFRTTNIKTQEGHDIFIPNSIIVNNSLTNYTFDSRRRFEFVIQIDHSNDVDRAKQIILDSVMKVSEVLKNPSPFVVVSEITTSVSLKAFYWIDTAANPRSIPEIKSEAIEISRKELNNGGIYLSELTQVKIVNEAIPLEIKNDKQL